MTETQVDSEAGEVIAQSNGLACTRTSPTLPIYKTRCCR